MYYTKVWGQKDFVHVFERNLLFVPRLHLFIQNYSLKKRENKSNTLWHITFQNNCFCYIHLRYFLECNVNVIYYCDVKNTFSVYITPVRHQSNMLIWGSRYILFYNYQCTKKVMLLDIFLGNFVTFLYRILWWIEIWNRNVGYINLYTFIKMYLFIYAFCFTCRRIQSTFAQCQCPG